MNKELSEVPANLEDAIIKAGSPINLLRSSNMGPHSFPVIPSEFTNWRDEQKAWKESVALLELSYHMTELHLRGPDIVPFISELATNRFDDLQPMCAKQLVLVGPDGRLISDAIIFRESEDFIRIVGPPTASNWVQFNCEKSEYRIDWFRDDSMIVPRERRDVFRFQLQGPNALALVREVSEGTLPEIKFFHVGEFTIGGKKVRALRHGMAGKPGFEIIGAWEDQYTVRESVVRIGKKYGLRKAGSITFGTVSQESGWMPRPLPAIYDSAEMKEFRQWLPANSFEAAGSLGGSYVSDDISDYYIDPVEVGYGNLIDFEHEFIGRDALMERKKYQKRTKVTLVWNNDDVFAAIRDSLIPGHRCPKYIDLPVPVYASFPADSVELNCEHIGISHRMSFSSNAGAILSQAIIDLEHSELGTEAVLLWGEPDSRRKTVEKHEVCEIRVTIAPVPYYKKSIKDD